MDFDLLLAALSRPSAYPQTVATVEVIQTHISLVFLAGDHVYKLKKPVRFPFLDFSTLENRLHDCEEEVRLNRRLAPGVYLGVVPICLQEGHVRVEGEGEIVEWCVKMRRLPPEASLLQYLLRGELSRLLLHELAIRLAAFHEQGRLTNPDDTRLFVPGVRANVLDIYDQAAPACGTTLSASIHQRLLKLTTQRFAEVESLLQRRADAGLVCDAHGDLHLDHVYHFPEQPPPADWLMLDCITFSKRLRFLDPIADMAFLVMDLLVQRRPDLASAFSDAYFSASQDHEGRALLPLFVAYRASVRGLVEGLKASEKEVAQVERQDAIERAHRYWLLALSQLEVSEARPCLLLVGGLPGTGKSTLAQHLSAQAHFVLIRSDEVRKQLAHLPTDQLTPEEQRELLYQETSKEAVYRECWHRAQQWLLAGQRVILDASFSRRARRQFMADGARSLGIPCCMVLCSASSDIIRARLAGRSGDASDANWEVYRQLQADWEEPSVDETIPAMSLCTEADPEQLAARVVNWLREQGLC